MRIIDKPESQQNCPGEQHALRWYQPNGSQRPLYANPVLGDVLVASVSRSAICEAAGPIVEVRRRHPWAPLVIVVRGMEALHLTAAAKLLQQTAARVLDDGSTNFVEWRRQLLNTETLANDFASMLHLQRPKLRRKTTDMICSLISAGATGKAFEEVVGSLDDQIRAIEARLHRSRLQPPSAYHRFGAFTHSIAALARDPHMRVRDVIGFSGYADRATFTRSIKQHLGTSPSRARLRVPWEWIAHRMQLYGKS